MQNHHPHNHQHHHQEPSSLARKPPRPPPISISHSPNPDPSAPPDSLTTRSSNLDSPLHLDSPLQFETPRDKQPPPLPAPSSPPTKNGGGNGNGNGNSYGGPIVANEKFYSPLTSPLPVTPPNDNPPPRQARLKSKDEAVPLQYGGGGGAGGGGGGERSWRVPLESGDVRTNGSSRRPTKKKDVTSKIGLGIRVLDVAFCLVSFTVMATDKTQGWTGDSFDHYKEYRFCLTVNIIGFVYAGFQVIDLAYHLATGDHVINHHLRYQFDFVMDQIMAYLLISASSSAATRVVDWQLNWGKDEFTEKATASISMAFIAFLTFAMSSLISGYSLCTSDFS